MSGQILPYLPFVSLLAAGFIALPRAWAMRRRGMAVVAVDRQRSAGELALDAILFATLVLWFYLVVAATGWLPIGFLPSWLTTKLMDGPAPQFLGAALLVGWLFMYAWGVRALGDSWRLGIDRKGDSSLVTDGVFRWSRNPIYLAFNMLFWGTALIAGQVVYVLLAVLLSLLLHAIILREERFLAARFGEQFAAYGKRVGRYATWRR